MAVYEKPGTESKREKPKPVEGPEKVLRIIRNYYTDSRDSLKRRERIDRSISNNAAFNGYFDFTDKVEGQSCESLPKVTTAVESFSAFIRRGLAQYGEWFRVDMPLDPLLSPEDVSKLLKEYLRDMPDGELGTKSIEQVLSDGAKCGALDSLVAFKVHGSRRKRKRPYGVQGDSKERWRLIIDLMPIEDYFPDPTGRKLYEIHAKQVDLFTVMRGAEAGAYDKAQAELLKGGSWHGQDQETDKDQLNRDEVRTTSSRATVGVQEFYGTLIDSDGALVEEDVYACVANEKHLLSGPKPIKAWCGSPFAVGPLTRVPHSVWHRAVMDYVSDLNQSLNELYNLIFDAGVSAVHGVKEIRLSWLEDPGSVAGGVSPQQTIAINESAPSGASAITVPKTGSLPGEVMGLFQAVEREILEAAMTNEMKIGSLPEKKILATEIISSDQQTAVLLDAVLGEYEQVLSVALTKAWQLIMQNADDLDAGTVIRAIGVERATELAEMSEKDRYDRYVADSRVIVTGLSSISQRSQELRRIIATIATVRSDPILAAEYQSKIDGKKLFERIFALAGVDLMDISRTEDESSRQQQPNNVPNNVGGEPNNIGGEPAAPTDVLPPQPSVGGPGGNIAIPLV